MKSFHFLLIVTVGVMQWIGWAHGSVLNYKSETSNSSTLDYLTAPNANEHPETPANAEFRRGVSALLKSDLRTADQAFRKASKLDPDLIGPYLGLAELALRHNRPSEAKNWLESADKAQPGSDAAQLGWGRYYMAMGQQPAAEQAFKQAIALRPSASVYLELGNIYLAQPKRREEALTLFKQAAALAPNNASVQYSLASGLAANGQVDKALLTFQQASHLSPNDPEPWRAIGRLHAEQNRFAEATAAMDEGLKRHPNYLPLLVDRGDIAAAQGKLDQATRYYEKAVQQAPTNAPLLTKLGLGYQLRQRWKEAESTYQRALKIAPKNGDIYNNLAWLYLGQGRRLDDALAMATKATQLNARHAGYLDTLGWIRKQRGELEKAETALLAAITLHPENPEFIYHLGVVYADQGKLVDAKSAMQRALALNPRFPGAPDARRRLEALHN